MASTDRKRVVILGGGFAGIYTAQYLEKALGRADDFEIVLINKENYFVFQPLLPEVITGNIGILDTVNPIRRLLPKTTLQVRDVEAIDVENRTITCSPGFRPHAHVVRFDHLVLALGNVTDFRGMRGLPEHAFPFKDLGDAVRLRNHIIHVLDEAAIECDDAEFRTRLLTFVVAGGGFSGVEVASELNDFVREVTRTYRGFDPKEVRVVLLHSGDRILPEVTEKLAHFAEKILKSRGVEIMLGVRLAAATGEDAILTDGTRIPTKTLVSTVPSSSHPLIDAINLPKGKNGRLLATRELSVEGSDCIWALGDCALVPSPEDDGTFSPPTAQHAIRQAKTAAQNIVASMRGGDKATFDFKGLGKMGSLGKHSAVAEIFGMNFSGFLAWWMWRTIYLMKMPGWGRRLKVALGWTLDVLLPAELVQLKLGGVSGITQEHFEPGQDVFRQGDLGDRVYVIINGAAEVVINTNGDERKLADLKQGDFFGEMALLTNAPRSATVRATNSLDTLSLNKREFRMLVAHLPDLRASFEKVMHERMTSNANAMLQMLDKERARVAKRGG